MQNLFLDEQCSQKYKKVKLADAQGKKSFGNKSSK